MTKIFNYLIVIAMVYAIPLLILFSIASLMERNYKQKSKYPDTEIPTHFQIIRKEVRAIMHDYYKWIKSDWVKETDLSEAQKAIWKEKIRKKKQK